MLKTLGPRLANIGLRALSMGSKFALVIILARVLLPSEIGFYGLFSATIGFCVLVIGGDYYTYSQRELLGQEKSRWSFILQHHAIAVLILYIILLPGLLIIFVYGLMPWSSIYWFFAILLAEHVAQEINRFLTVMHHQLLASIVLFIRVGAWVWIVLPLMWLMPMFCMLETIFVAWLVGCVTAIVFGCVIIWKELTPWRSWPVNWGWLRKGFTIGSFFLIGTMCFRALLTFDRYSVEALVGSDLLGVYVLYMGMAMAVISVLDPAVFSFLYPKLVAANLQNDTPLYNNLMRELFWSSTLVSAFIAIIVALISPYVLEWTGRSLYLQHIHILWLLLFMSFVYAVGMVPHYGLYAHSADKSLLMAHLSSLAIFLGVLIPASKLFPFEATALSLISAFSWMGMYKYWSYTKIRSLQN